MSKATYTEVSETRSVITEDNGHVYHITTVIERQDWEDGAAYKITTSYRATTEGYRHIMVNKSSAPWTD